MRGKLCYLTSHQLHEQLHKPNAGWDLGRVHSWPPTVYKTKRQRGDSFTQQMFRCTRTKYLSLPYSWILDASWTWAVMWTVQNAFSTILPKTVVLCVQGTGKTSAVMCRGARRCDRIYCSAMKESDLFLTADNTFVTEGDYHGVN